MHNTVCNSMLHTHHPCFRRCELQCEIFRWGREQSEKFSDGDGYGDDDDGRRYAYRLNNVLGNINRHGRRSANRVRIRNVLLPRQQVAKFSGAPENPAKLPFSLHSWPPTRPPHTHIRCRAGTESARYFAAPMKYTQSTAFINVFDLMCTVD